MLLNFFKSVNLIRYIIILLLLSIVFTQNGKVNYTGKVKSDYIISGQDYIANDDGSLLMYVNIWGHVKNPGTYLVYEGIDMMTLISLAGGPSTGANLSKIRLINDKKEQIINLNNYLAGHPDSQITINPHDTIYIKESFGSYIFTKVNILNTLLQIINISYTISRLQ